MWALAGPSARRLGHVRDQSGAWACTLPSIVYSTPPRRALRLRHRNTLRPCLNILKKGARCLHSFVVVWRQLASGVRWSRWRAVGSGAALEHVTRHVRPACTPAIVKSSATCDACTQGTALPATRNTEPAVRTHDKETATTRNVRSSATAIPPVTFLASLLLAIITTIPYAGPLPPRPDSPDVA